MADNGDTENHHVEDNGFEAEQEAGSHEKEYSVGQTDKRAGRAMDPTVLKGIVGIVAGCALVIMAYALLARDQETPAVETSGVKEYQEWMSGGGFGNIGSTAASEPEEGGFDFGPIQEQLNSQRTALEQRNTTLQAQVQQLQSSLADLSNRADDDDSKLVAELSKALQETQEQNAQMAQQMREEFANQLQSLRAANEKRMTQQDQTFETLRRENQALQTQIATASNDAALQAQEAEAERRRQQQREADLAERRQQQQAQLRARVQSEAVIYDNGSSSDGAGTSSADNEALDQLNPRGQSRDGTLRAFVTGGAAATPTEQATAIANPAYTVLQGTMIQATLENAVASSLPGTASAVVNYPVWSFDQSQVLIPSGSRLFGSYSSDVDIGQGRILIGWNRLVTPDGQSVQLSAFGGDQMGRSGITGRVDTRFGTRFGNAALISLLGAGPSIAAAQIDDDTTSDIARDVTEDLGDATSSAAADYASLPPIITVEQGSAITVMVDRDLEFF
tara:strand:- start:7687 stop:9204 length:1518 start_codon:yes stop_codon:yes gene_type:complete